MRRDYPPRCGVCGVEIENALALTCGPTCSRIAAEDLDASEPREREAPDDYEGDAYWRDIDIRIDLEKEEGP